MVRYPDIAALGDLKGRRVLVRSDLNVPLRSGRVSDDGRIRASVPTLRLLAEAGARVVVAAHLGRPQGEPDPRYSLAPVVAPLEHLLGRRVTLAEDTVGAGARAAVEGLADGEVVVLENVRFHPGETSADDRTRGAFADELARLADVFVSDGFGVAHRKQASVYDIAQRLPHAAGELVRTEVEVLERLTESPERPYVLVLGGSKVSDKLAVIEHLMTRADSLVIGGGMAFTFLAALGHEVGTSLVEQDQVDVCAGYLRRAAQTGVRVVLPTDIVVTRGFPTAGEPVLSEVVPAAEIPPDRMGLDIGPASAQEFGAAVRAARTVFWNGPMGVFEFPELAEGTRSLADALTEVQGLSVVGGGDSAAAVRALGFAEDSFGHISTGGGASLEYLEGKDLPGLRVLTEPVGRAGPGTS